MKKFTIILIILFAAAFKANAQYAALSIPYNPYPYNTGTNVLMNTDDIWSNVINLPFNFFFYGNNYNQIVIGGNGCVSFSTLNAGAYCAWSYTATCPDSNIISGSTGPYIFSPYHDMNPGVGGSVYYAIYDSAPYRKFVISWYNIPMFSCNSLLATQQIVLYESLNNIDVYMQNKPLCTTWNGGVAVIGIQDFSGTNGVTPPGRNTGAWAATNEAWRFTLGPYGIISGNIFQDLNLNCNLDSGEYKLSNWMVKVDPIPFYATTNSNGFYSVFLDTGTYTVSQIPLNNLWGLGCPSSPDYYTVTLAQYDSSDANDFAVKANILCAYLNVDISTWMLRPCSTSYYTVYYCNNGTIPANNVYIEVEFDTVVTPVSSTLPWTSQNGNVYTFDIGTLNPLQCGSFYITTTVSCNAVVGSTHCIEARIYPDTLCFPPDSTWDHSSVSVEGICVNDSLACFTIYNTGDSGTGDMQNPSDYRIYENNVLVFTGQFQLDGGDSLIICWPTNGNAIRLEADQRPGHPGNSHPQETVEDCGDTTGNSLGQIILIPEDDIDYNVEIDCREISASYDPNEKCVKPVGLTQYHYIDSSDILEYQINFQNTGNDTAFKVVIRDTLSEYLDVTAIETGAGSHPYTFEIYGQGILKWTFNNILLPDSNINEPASHGFVKFKVHQKQGNTQGTLIENHAEIIFDSNAPVFTGTVWNIVNDTNIVVAVKPEIYNNTIDVNVFPNPFNDYITFVISGKNETEKYCLILLDLMGKEVRKTENISGDIFRVYKNNLLPGMYFYMLKGEKQIVAVGKIIVG
ncbi:MAG: T9SS type A sorting domain-containing protein [Bacteroidota bacterium]